MACWLDRITQLYDAWAIRVLVLFSFALHVVLILFADIRRRKATSFWRVILWVANQSVDWTATYVLGNLSLGSTSQQQQLIAFWASFLLVHLGRPDNVSAYSLEDDKLSGRQVVEVISQFIGALFVLFKHIPFCDGGTLFPAAPIMFAVGFAKYVERTLALWRGDFGSIRRSGEKQKRRSFSADPCGGQELDDEQALLVAHRIFRISKGAFADYSVVKDPLKHPDDRDIHDERDTESFPHGWKGMCKVVEMELSLMYDILYTKAVIVHTWHGYLLRFVSPPLTAVAFLLFWFYNKAGQRRVDVVITYILLTATFLVDLRWLVGALGSTWTYAFLNDMASTRWCWLRHKLLCTGRWHRLRKLKEGLFEEIREILKEAYPAKAEDKPPAKAEDKLPEWLAAKPPPPKPPKPDEAARRRRLLDEALDFAPELGQDILVLHIATDVFLRCSHQNPELSPCVKKAIKALSDYMMFLVAVRPDMVPGLKLSSLHKTTRVALEHIWRSCPSSTAREKKLACILRNMEKEPSKENTESNRKNTESNRKRNSKRKKSLLYDSSIILSDGARLANVLLGLLKNEHPPTDEAYEVTARIFKIEKLRGGVYRPNEKELLEAIFSGWVRMQNEQELLEAIFHVWVRLQNDKELLGAIFHVWVRIQNDKELLEAIFHVWVVRIQNEQELLEAIFSGWVRIQNEQELLEAIFHVWVRLQNDKETADYEEARAETARIFNIENLRSGVYKPNELLKAIFRGWVRMLIYVSVRCSRDSHAKQLSRGGELTTLVWILAEHASIFGIPE